MRGVRAPCMRMSGADNQATAALSCRPWRGVSSSGAMKIMKNRDMDVPDSFLGRRGVFGLRWACLFLPLV